MATCKRQLASLQVVVVVVVVLLLSCRLWEFTPKSKIPAFFSFFFIPSVRVTNAFFYYYDVLSSSTTYYYYSLLSSYYYYFT